MSKATDIIKISNDRESNGFLSKWQHAAFSRLFASWGKLQLSSKYNLHRCMNSACNKIYYSNIPPIITYSHK
jgi:hypothetical protein